MEFESLHKEYRKKHLIKKPLFFGAIAGTLLLIVYFGVLSFANSFTHAILQFKSMWYWITLLVLGFSTQIGLYTYIKMATKLKALGGAATSSIATAGGISTTSMVACCAHHLTEVIPILGISAAAIFLNQFQTLFIVVGVLSNLIGINFMLKIIQEHSLYNKSSGVFVYLMKVNMKKTIYVTSVFSIFIFSIVLYNSL